MVCGDSSTPSPASTLYKDVVGIVGGTGPAASVALYRMIVDGEDCSGDEGHIPVLIHNNPQLFCTSSGPEQELLRTILCLYNAGATTIAIACNAAHVYLDVLKAQLPEGIRFLHMIDLCSKFVIEQDMRRVGILCARVTKESGIFPKSLQKVDEALRSPGQTLYEADGNDEKNGVAESDLEILLPDEKTQDNVDEGIGHIKAGKAGDSAIRKIFEDAAVRLVRKGAQCIVIGCTDIPLCFSSQTCKDFPVPLIDPMQVLADEIIRVTNESKLAL